MREYVGGYDDWLRQAQQQTQPIATEKTKSNIESGTLASEDSGAGNLAVAVKLSFKEKQELERIPKVIEELESSIAAMHDEMSEPEYYKQPKNKLAQAQASLEDLKKRLAETYSRWGKTSKLE